MLSELNPMEWVSVSSLSLSLAALLARFFTNDGRVSARSHLLTAVVVLALLSAGLGTFYSIKRASDISTLSEEIYMALGNQEKTTDQLLVEIGSQRDMNFNAAITNLKAAHSIASYVDHIPIRGERLNAVRLWRALPK